MTKKYPRLYKDTMTTKEVMEAVESLNTTRSTFKWLKRKNVSEYPIDSRTSVWDRAEVLKELGD